MFNLQGSEIIIILLLALVVLGPEKLPDAIRKFSKAYGELKKMGTGFQTELKSALDEPMKEMRETAQLLQDAADPNKIADQVEADAAKRAQQQAAAAAGVDDRPQGTLAPGATVADSTLAEGPVADAPATEAPVTEAPVTEGPVNQVAAANARAKLADADMPTPNGKAVAADLSAVSTHSPADSSPTAMNGAAGNGAALDELATLAPPTGAASQLLPPPVASVPEAAEAAEAVEAES